MPILRVHNRVTKNLLEKDTFMNKLSTVEDFDDIDVSIGIISSMPLD